MTENIKARFIDPMVDWSFKRLFGSEVNKDILIEFLKVIFPDAGITDISYIPTEQLGIMEEDRKAVFDVLCRTADGREFLVEMQRGAQRHFFERALFYTSFPIMKQGRKSLAEEKDDGERPWNFRLDGVFFLGVLNFRYEDDELTEHRYRLKEATTGKTMTGKLEFVFVEVAKFDKREDELVTDLDRWLYMLKNLSRLLERPAALRDRIFGRIFDVAEIASLDDNDKRKYINAMNTERDTYNQIEYAREMGEERGMMQERCAFIARMKEMGMSSQMICDILGLSEEELAQIDDFKKKYINEMNTKRDTYNQIEYAREQGMEKGIEQGMERGKAEGKTEDAIKMLGLGLPVGTISAVTGFSEEQIQELRSRQ